MLYVLLLTTQHNLCEKFDRKSVSFTKKFMCILVYGLDHLVYVIKVSRGENQNDEFNSDQN